MLAVLIILALSLAKLNASSAAVLKGIPRVPRMNYK